MSVVTPARGCYAVADECSGPGRDRRGKGALLPRGGRRTVWLWRVDHWMGGVLGRRRRRPVTAVCLLVTSCGRGAAG